MKWPEDPKGNIDGTVRTGTGSTSQRVRLRDVVRDLHSGMRTRAFLDKYDLSLSEFQEVLKRLIREGYFSIEDFKAWKAHLPTSAAPTEEPESDEISDEGSPGGVSNIETFILAEPEKNHSWALQLFSTKREEMKGARFKVNLQGKKYLFVVEEMLFRGSVNMLEEEPESPHDVQRRRQEALQYIARHGWSAYLENRAFIANVEGENRNSRKKARLVLLHCRNQTFLAALHTPAPTVNLYVASSLKKLHQRLAKSVDMGDFTL
jgi:hypothetical protein